MSAHTPGPWSVRPPSVLVNAEGRSIASGGNNRSIVGAELAASLRLAAAAPELLAALREALAYSDAITDHQGRGFFSWAPAARAAIAKATKP